MVTSVKGNIVQQIPVQQQPTQPQQGQQQPQTPQSIMQSPSQQLINAAILPNAAGGQPVAVWQQRTDQSITYFMSMIRTPC